MHGKVKIELDPRIKPGQLIHVHSGRTATANVFQINQDFRITMVVHNFSTSAATSELELVDDLLNPFSIGPVDAFSAVVRAVNPQFQTKALASLMATKEWDIELTVLAKDYA